MNKIEMLYKADTGNAAKIGFEATVFQNDRIGYKVYNVDSDIEYHYDLADGILELPTAEYLKWLEEKLESLQKLPANNI
jgi:hypothetical protein